MGISHEYLNWLSDRVESPVRGNPAHTHYLLTEQLHNTEFINLVPNDDNRIGDGLELRNSFVDARGSVTDEEHAELWEHPCSLLEMLIAMAIRMAYEVEYLQDGDGGVRRWFWVLIKNADLDQYTDEVYMEKNPEGYIRARLSVINHRRYEYNGNGGLFPLRNPLDDQRDVELWYQMSCWMMENTEI